MNFPHFVVVEVQINALAVIPSQIGKQTADRQRFVVQKKYICTILCTSLQGQFVILSTRKKKFFFSSKLLSWHLILHNSYYIMYAVPGLLEIQILYINKNHTNFFSTWCRKNLDINILGFFSSIRRKKIHCILHRNCDCT